MMRPPSILGTPTRYARHAAVVVALFLSHAVACAQNGIGVTSDRMRSTLGSSFTFTPDVTPSGVDMYSAMANDQTGVVVQLFGGESGGQLASATIVAYNQASASALWSKAEAHIEAFLSTMSPQAYPWLSKLLKRASKGKPIIEHATFGSVALRLELTPVGRDYMFTLVAKPAGSR